MKKLFLVFVVSAIVSSSVQAKYSGGSGTAGDPYRIGDACDLLTLAANTGDYDANFILVADINLDPNLPGNQVFTAAVIAPDTDISSAYFQGTPFTGVFDGNGLKIANLTINSYGDETSYPGYLGLFGYIEGPSPNSYGYKDIVKNLTIENVNITGNSFSLGNSGGLVGYNSYGAISNCHSTIVVNSSEESSGIGGLIGYNDYGSVSNCSSVAIVSGGPGVYGMGGLVGYNYYGIINYCYATGSVSFFAYNPGQYTYGLGGLVGTNDHGDINDSWASGNVIASGSNPGNIPAEAFGGLVGYNDYGIIDECYATGNVNSIFSGDGGLVGVGSGGTISNCYATGNVTGLWLVGGLAGENAGTIINCYSTGAVFGNSYFGGLVGDNDDPYGTITASFWDVNTSGLTVSDGGEGNTTAEMKTESTFTDAGWDFVGETANGTDDIWRMCVDNVNYPLLWWQFNKADFTCPDGVDFADFAELAEWWNHTDCADNNNCDNTDMDLSGTVDIYDLKLFCDNWLEETD